MNTKPVARSKILICTIVLLFAVAAVSAVSKSLEEESFISYVADTQKQDIHFYWKDDKDQPIRSIQNLKWWIEQRGEKLVFAMNGGMYKQDNTPQGLYIENGKTLTRCDTSGGNGNFYLKPNGIFYITTNKEAVVCKTEDFSNTGKIAWATQSGPMLVADGQIHPAFKKGSTNLNIRNGVGILPGNKIIFVMSKKEINFYDFAMFFKNKGCQNALYLDGFVSRTYLPEKQWIQTDGNFGVIIGVTKPN